MDYCVYLSIECSGLKHVIMTTFNGISAEVRSHMKRMGVTGIAINVLLTPSSINQYKALSTGDEKHIFTRGDSLLVILEMNLVSSFIFP